MVSQAKRKKYFINFSIQFKYIMMSVFPVILMSLLSIYFVMHSGESLMEKQKTEIMAEMSALHQAVQQRQAVRLPKDASNQFDILTKRLNMLQDELNIQYYYLVEEWAQMRMKLLAILFIGILASGGVSLIFSHRIAGPAYRLKMAIDALQEGKETGHIKVRPDDEFQDLANSLETLRVILKDRGYIK